VSETVSSAKWLNNTLRCCGIDSETFKQRLIRYIFLTAHLLPFLPRYIFIDYLEILLNIRNFPLVNLELIICYMCYLSLISRELGGKYWESALMLT
jgi:hypothetical protein